MPRRAVRKRPTTDSPATGSSSVLSALAAAEEGDTNKTLNPRVTSKTIMWIDRFVKQAEDELLTTKNELAEWQCPFLRLGKELDRWLKYSSDELVIFTTENYQVNSGDDAVAVLLKFEEVYADHFALIRPLLSHEFLSLHQQATREVFPPVIAQWELWHRQMVAVRAGIDSGEVTSTELTCSILPKPGDRGIVKRIAYFSLSQQEAEHRIAPRFTVSQRQSTSWNVEMKAKEICVDFPLPFVYEEADPYLVDPFRPHQSSFSISSLLGCERSVGGAHVLPAFFWAVIGALIPSPAVPIQHLPPKKRVPGENLETITRSSETKQVFSVKSMFPIKRFPWGWYNTQEGSIQLWRAPIGVETNHKKNAPSFPQIFHDAGKKKSVTIDPWERELVMENGTLLVFLCTFHFTEMVPCAWDPNRKLQSKRALYMYEVFRLPPLHDPTAKMQLVNQVVIAEGRGKYGSCSPRTYGDGLLAQPRAVFADGDLLCQMCVGETFASSAPAFALSSNLAKYRLWQLPTQLVALIKGPQEHRDLFMKTEAANYKDDDGDSQPHPYLCDDGQLPPSNAFFVCDPVSLLKGQQRAAANDDEANEDKNFVVPFQTPRPCDWMLRSKLLSPDDHWQQQEESAEEERARREASTSRHVALITHGNSEWSFIDLDNCRALNAPFTISQWQKDVGSWANPAPTTARFLLSPSIRPSIFSVDPVLQLENRKQCCIRIHQKLREAPDSQLGDIDVSVEVVDERFAVHPPKKSESLGLLVGW